MDFAGVAAILLGVIIATFFFASELRDGRNPVDPYKAYRRNLGKAILLGLELLVAADIIRTVAVTPTFTSVGVLAVIVAVRTFLSMTLELETSGRWPWQRNQPRPLALRSVEQSDGGSMTS